MTQLKQSMGGFEKTDGGIQPSSSGYPVGVVGGQSSKCGSALERHAQDAPVFLNAVSSSRFLLPPVPESFHVSLDGTDAGD
jgi:hypothetical protein